MSQSVLSKLFNKKLTTDLWNRCLIYDVEVKYGPDEVEGHWENPAAMGVASCVVYIPKLYRYRFFNHTPVEEVKLQQLLEKIPYRVGFNSIKFDNRVIFGNDYSTSPWTGKDNDIDLMQIFGAAEFPECETPAEVMDRIYGKREPKIRSLNAYTFATVGLKKNAHGANAPFLFRQGKFAELWEYNLNDVVMTTQLLMFILQNRFVLNGNGTRIDLV